MLNQNQEEWKVDAHVHPFLLRSPRCSQDGPWNDVAVAYFARLDLREIATEIANNVCALKVLRKANQRLIALAPGTSAIPHDFFFTEFA
jgi:hypothetical protein